ANIARVVSIVMLAAIAWVTVSEVREYDGGIGWPLMGDFTLLSVWLALVAELLFVSVALWRSLGRGAAARWLITALQLNGAFAGVMLVAYFILGVRHTATMLEPRLSVLGIMNTVPPLWLLMCVQSFAGLSALRQQATQVGQPSSPVELQPPG
ncbi:MAG: hypothetical protein JWM53_333, partial [bacterium]|nr:hypothetical protein [bacterium]